LRAVAQITEGTNGFTGKLGLEGNEFSGNKSEFHGSFYGPDAAEIGATFSSSDDSAAMVGALWGGRNGYPINQSTNLLNPEHATFFAPISASMKATIDGSGIASGATDAAPISAIYVNRDAMIRLVYYADGHVTNNINYGKLANKQFLANTADLISGLQWDGRLSMGVADAFLYGNMTSVASMPRSGTASFSANLRGTVMPAGEAMRSISGLGSLKADFATARISGLGSYSTHAFSADNLGGYGQATNGNGNWSSNATIGSNSSSFSGDFGTTGALTYNGTIKGGFFGPAAEEIGSVVNAGSNDGGLLVAVLGGARGTDISASQQGLLGLTSSTDLQNVSGDFTITSNTSGRHASVNNTRTVNYDPTSHSYVVKTGPYETGDQSVRTIANITLTDRNAAESNASFDVYHGTNYDAKIYRPGLGNPEIALTYTSFAHISWRKDEVAYPESIQSYVAFGGRTPSYQMPTSGSASYSGVLYGEGYLGTTQGAATLSGTSRLNANFATNELALTLNAIATDKASGAAYVLGNFVYAWPEGYGCTECDRSAFALRSPSGQVVGQFNGPHAEEFAAGFTLNFDPGDGQYTHSSSFAGIAIGKKD
jgi:hypothetical protein